MWILELDRDILLAVNGFHAPWADTLMWAVSAKFVWIPLYVLLAYLVVRAKGWKEGLIWILGVSAVIAIADQICVSQLLRHTVARPRPANLEESPIAQYVRVVNDYRSGRFGFPSAHAGNTAGLVCYFHLIMRKRWLLACLILWCALVCYSRMYLGVHYLGDLLGGVFIGILAGAFVYYIIHKFIIPRVVRQA